MTRQKLRWLFMGGVCGILFSIAFLWSVRPDLFQSAEDEAREMSRWNLPNSFVNDHFPRLEAEGKVLELNYVQGKGKHMMKVATVYWDATALCLLYSITTPADSFLASLSLPLRTNNGVTSREIGDDKVVDVWGQELTPRGVNSVVAVETAAWMQCYDAPAADVSTLYVTIGSPKVVEPAEFVVKLE